MNCLASLTTLGLCLAGLQPRSAMAAILPPEQTGNFNVGDFLNHRMVVYDSAGNYMHDFTAPGLSGPRGIVIRADGTTYVASQFTDEVFVFDAQGRFQTKFTVPS